MFSRAFASSVRSMGSMTTPLAASGPAMSRYFSASASVAASKIFVGGLSWNINENELKEHFEQFGSITDVNIPLNPEGKSRGFGFVEFGDEQPSGKTSKEIVEEAIAQTDQTELDGRSISVNEANERRERSEGGFSRGRGGGRGRGGSRGGYGGSRGGYGGHDKYGRSSDY